MPVTHPPTARRTLGRIAVTGVGVSLLLSGCNGSDPTPTVTSTTSSASTSSSSPAQSSSSSSSPQPLIIPDAAKKHTEAGAIAFAQFFVRTLGQTQVSGDTTTIRQASAKGCEYCRDFMRAVEAKTKKGQHQEIDRSRVKLVKSRGIDDQGRPIVDVYVHDPGGTIIDKTGAEVRSYPALNFKVRLRLQWTARGWRTEAGATS